jgi:hypothetical protein
MSGRRSLQSDNLLLIAATAILILTAQRSEGAPKNEPWAYEFSGRGPRRFRSREFAARTRTAFR